MESAMSVAQSWQQSRTAQFTARRGPVGTLITVDGELDAANADQLVAYVQQNVNRSRRVILDLRGLKFVGTAGFSALHRINVMCSAAQVSWAMAPSPAVARLLRVCDPDGTLPVTTQKAEPLLEPLWVEDDENPRPLLQLVPQPR
ncbi:STAS domain-containing protein [Mycobacterium sp. 852002-10029_SCH5224772]|uniref:STAS domain-containing protein n=1 Tax=Mycobacterium sp. 852002-10029_SCH5224772 TaxID=1834083 RepID=UPI0007FDD9AF|nr:STAS domain-containing protein [Mycobacterium sp. 852002-10029_SCH5224772]OBF11561.1 sulfate transporter [Mycobacterium sp. 852002-10029_SCH5224772]